MTNENKTKGTKAIEGGLSVETFTTLSHALRAMADCMTCLKDEKGFEFVLPGKIHNDPIEMHFCKMRGVSGMNMALSVETFCQNYRSVLLRDIASLSKNNDGTFNRIQHESFFKNTTECTKNMKMTWQKF